MQIKTKAEFYRLWQAGLLGNRPLTWPDLAALRRSGFTGLVTCRSGGKAGGPCVYGVPARDAARVTAGWPAPTFNGPVPEDRLLIQGEAARLVGGLALTYSTAPGLRMREAMKQARRAQGIAAHAILGAYLWPASRDDLDALWDLYPDAVIEFGAYDCAVGDQPRRNTVVWEVRDY